MTRAGEDCLSFYSNGTANSPANNVVTNLVCSNPSAKAPGIYSGVSFIGARGNSVQGSVIINDNAGRYGVSEAPDSKSAVSPSGNHFSGQMARGRGGAARWLSPTSGAR